MQKRLLVAVFVLLLIPGMVQAGWLWGPSNYTECVAKYVAPAKCKRAAYMLNSTCIMEYEEKKDSWSWQAFYR